MISLAGLQREPSSSTIREDASIHDLDAAAWDRLAAPHGIYLSHAWLASVEASVLSRPRYLSIWSGSDLRAALPLYVMADEPNPAYDVARLLGQAPGDRYPVMLAGTRTAYRNTWLLDAELAPTARHQLLRDLLAEAARQTVQAGARTLAVSFLDDPGVALLQAAGALPPEVRLAEVDLTIDLPIGTDDYYATLGSHRARRLRADERRFARAGYDVRREPLAEFAPVGGPMVAHLCRSHGTPMTDERGISYLRDIAEHFGAQTLTFAAYLKGRPVACSVSLVDHRAVYVRTFGWADGVDLDAGEYFALSYVRPIEWARTHQRTQVHLGVGSYRPKLLRGAVPRAAWTVSYLPTDVEAAAAADTARRSRRNAVDAWSRTYLAPEDGRRLDVPDL